MQIEYSRNRLFALLSAIVLPGHLPMMFGFPISNFIIFLAFFSFPYAFLYAVSGELVKWLKFEFKNNKLVLHWMGSVEVELHYSEKINGLGYSPRFGGILFESSAFLCYVLILPDWLMKNKNVFYNGIASSVPEKSSLYSRLMHSHNKS